MRSGSGIRLNCRNPFDAIRLLAILLSISFLLSFVPLVYGQEGYKPPQDRPGPAAERIIFRQVHVDQAAAEIRRGSIDLYFTGLKIEAAKDLLRRGDVEVIEVPATVISLILNPAPAPEGQLNPFSIKEVRRAIQYLVDRNFIANSIYGGLAVPMYTLVSPFDFDYLTIFEDLKRLGIRYDPDLARRMIKDAMEAAGAKLVDGKWIYNGREVEIRIIGRVEDERRLIASYLASKLEELGFKVQLIQKEFAPAISTVYLTDPKSLEWHVYTEGWGKGAIERYDYASINQFCAPWFGYMPGWREVGFWQYTNDELDSLGRKIFAGEFKNVEERNQLYKRVLEICTDESVRVWVVTVLNAFPVSRVVTGLVVDLSSGPRSLYTLREAYRTDGPTITVGHLHVWTPRSAWNPIGGFGDVYSVDIWRQLSDPPIARHPYSGEPIPFRASFLVETAGPDGQLTVPSDAFIWDARSSAWRYVEPGTVAKSKVTFDLSKYLGKRWHHGQEITIADLLYSIYQVFDVVYNPRKSSIEVSIAATLKPVLDLFKGFRIVDGTRLEVYVDYWHFDPNYIAEFASPTGFSMPWEVLAAMDELVFAKRRAAYSDTASVRFGVNWLSVVEKTHIDDLKSILLELERTGRYPESVFVIGGKSYLTREEAIERYRAAIRWAEEHGNLAISQGPFFLNRFDAPAQSAELIAFRDPSYPFSPGHWIKLLGPRPEMRFVSVESTKLLPGTTGEVRARLSGPADASIRYFLLDPSTGELVAKGESEKVGSGEFVIRLGGEVTSRLRKGLYDLYLLAYSRSEVGLIYERRLTLELTEQVATTQKTTETVQGTKTLEEMTRAEAPATFQPASIALIIGVVAAIVATVVLLRKFRR